MFQVCKRFHILLNKEDIWKKACNLFWEKLETNLDIQSVVKESEKTWFWIGYCLSRKKNDFNLSWDFDVIKEQALFGNFKNDKLQGFGIKLSRTGMMFGVFRDGNIEKGTEIRRKHRYIGDFILGHRAHGNGKIIFRNGASYEGEWDVDRFHGNGVFRYPNGGYYTGQFEKGFCQGRGTVTYPDGFEFEDEFVQDNPKDDEKCIHPKVKQRLANDFCTADLSLSQWFYNCKRCKRDYCATCWNFCHQHNHEFEKCWDAFPCQCEDNCTQKCEEHLAKKQKI